MVWCIVMLYGILVLYDVCTIVIGGNMSCSRALCCIVWC